MSKLSTDRRAIAEDLLDEANEAPDRYSDVALYANQLAETTAELVTALERQVNLAHGGNTCAKADEAVRALRARRTDAISDLHGTVEAIETHETIFNARLEEWEESDD